jgi:hypothetical protein
VKAKGAAGLLEIEFNENGFEGKWKQGLEPGAMKGVWTAVLAGQEGGNAGSKTMQQLPKRVNQPEMIEYNQEGTTEFLVCLHFGQVTSTLVEDENDLLLEPGDGIEEFKFAETVDLSPFELSQWVLSRLEVVFDGDLDAPHKFNSITSVGIGSFPEEGAYYSQDCGLVLVGLKIYLKVDPASDELDENDLDDIFHVIVPRISNAGVVMSFTYFQEYSAEIISSIEDYIHPLSTELY